MQDSILLKLAKVADEYTNTSGTKVLMVAIETSADGEPMGMTLQKNSNPIVTIGMIEALYGLLEEEKQKAFDFLTNHGDKHVATSSAGLEESFKNNKPMSKEESTAKLNEVLSAFDLVREFKELKEEGDRIKDTNPERLVEIMVRMGEISEKIKNLGGPQPPIGESQPPKKDNQDPLDKFKDTF